MKTKYIGIDPDITESGFSVWCSEKKQFDRIGQLDFFTLLERIESILENDDVVVIIEAGWNNKKSNFHRRAGQTRAVGEKIAKSVGANHQVGKLFQEWCGRKNIRVRLATPRKSKVNAVEFRRLTGWNKRTNSEHRDSAMLVFGL